MRERVNTILATKTNNVIIVAPHGVDDTNTNDVAEATAELLGCYAVINNGFQRNDTVDVDKDLADCNRIDHCKQDVVYDEFLKPILKFKDISISSNSWPPAVTYIFYIHGCGNNVHKEVNENVDVIIGYGLGLAKHSLSCDEKDKLLLCDSFQTIGLVAYQASGGSKYAARDTNNLNQYFRKHDLNPWVQSFQLEIPRSNRIDKYISKDFGCKLAVVINRFMNSTHLKLTSQQLEKMEKNSKFI